MTWLLNEGGAQNGHSPACVSVFTDGGSLAHLILGAIAGSEFLTPRDSVIAATAFTGYQLSQANHVPWSRTGGELVEFAIGMLLGRFLPQMMKGGFEGFNEW